VRAAGPPMLPPDFSVTVARHRDTVTVAPTGELDLATTPLLGDHLAGLDDQDVTAVVLDLSGLTFLDSSGVALLHGTWRRAQRHRWMLTITGTPPQARRVLELCGLAELLPLVDP
jgi:anti-sigma B factor antagonist